MRSQTPANKAKGNLIPRSSTRSTIHGNVESISRKTSLGVPPDHQELAVGGSVWRRRIIHRVIAEFPGKTAKDERNQRLFVPLFQDLLRRKRDDRGVGFLRDLQSFRGGAGFVFRIGISEEQPGVLRFFSAERDRVVLADPADRNALCFKKAKVGNAGHEPANNFGSLVGRLVVHDENFSNLGLAGKRFDARRDRWFFIASRNDGADGGRKDGSGVGWFVGHVLVASEGLFPIWSGWASIAFDGNRAKNRELGRSSSGAGSLAALCDAELPAGRGLDCRKGREGLPVGGFRKGGASLGLQRKDCCAEFLGHLVPALRGRDPRAESTPETYRFAQRRDPRRRCRRGPRGLREISARPRRDIPHLPRSGYQR